MQRSCGTPAVPDGAGAASATPTVQPSRSGTPELRVSTVAAGLDQVWDVGFLPDGRMLVTERGGRLVLLSGTAEGATVAPVAADFGDLLVRGEGGLMGLVVHPDFAQSRRFTTCQTHTEGGRPVDIRLVTWTLSADGARAERVVDPLVGGLPVNPSGRHSGCRPTLAADGALLVGTGDTARGNLPQDLGSLGGKVLRADLATGRPAPGNPIDGSLVYTYGHRNVQGVAVRPSDGAVYTAEHGPTTDDEVNLLRPGGNYGWDPGQGGTVGGYDESVPMTDLERFPDAVAAAWSSGSPVEAVAGRGVPVGPAVGRPRRHAGRRGAAREQAAADDHRGGRRRDVGGGAGTARRDVRPPACGADGPGRRAVREHVERRRRPGAADRPGVRRAGPFRPHDQVG